MSEILGNIYDRFIAIVFWTVFFWYFWSLWKLVCWRKVFKTFFYLCFFYQNLAENVLVVCRRGAARTLIEQRFQSPADWFTIYPFIWMTWFWPKVPTYSYAKNDSYQNLGLVYEVFSFPKQVITVIHFLDLRMVMKLL